MTHAEMEAFLAICRHKNISKAADELYISQTSLSARLKGLEEELGYTLLLRGKGKREVTLTSRGQAFHGLALQYQNILQKMSTLDKDALPDKLRVSSINSVGNCLLTPVLERFLDKYPRIRLTMQSMEAEMACLSIIQGKTDMAFSTAKVETDEIVATPLLRDPFTVVCARQSAFPDTVSLEDLPVWDEVYNKWSAEYEFWHQTTFGSDATCQLQLDLMEQLGLFVSRPGKWALVPKSVAACLCASHDLRQCIPAFRVPDRSIYLLRARDGWAADSIGCFLDTLREVLQQSYGDDFLL